MRAELLKLVGRRVTLLLPTSASWWGPYELLRITPGHGYTGPAAAVFQVGEDEVFVALTFIVAARPAS